MLEDVVDDDLLGLVRVHTGVRVHVDDGILEPDQWDAQGSLQRLTGQQKALLEDGVKHFSPDRPTECIIRRWSRTLLAAMLNYWAHLHMDVHAQQQIKSSGVRTASCSEATVCIYDCCSAETITYTKGANWGQINNRVSLEYGTEWIKR